MSGNESDIDIKTAALPKKIAKPRIIEQNNPKKLTTKMMIIDALTELKTRKGVSLYAIKNHLTEEYQVNTEKLNYFIKKTLKTCVEDGTIVQLKGIGASGSFKLAANKVQPKKKKETEKDGIEVQKKKVKIDEKSEKTMKKPLEKKKVSKTKLKVKENELEVKSTKKITEKQKSVKEKQKEAKKTAAEDTEKKNKVQFAKDSQTPAKKRAVMKKRKSIGSIIKPPKMKPKNK